MDFTFLPGGSSVSRLRFRFVASPLVPWDAASAPFCFALRAIVGVCGRTIGFESSGKALKSSVQHQVGKTVELLTLPSM